MDSNKNIESLLDLIEKQKIIIDCIFENLTKDQHMIMMGEIANRIYLEYSKQNSDYNNDSN
jgi:hypothetical protein